MYPIEGGIIFIHILKWRRFFVSWTMIYDYFWNMVWGDKKVYKWSCRSWIKCPLGIKMSLHYFLLPYHLIALALLLRELFYRYRKKWKPCIQIWRHSFANILTYLKLSVESVVSDCQTTWKYKSMILISIYRLYSKSYSMIVVTLF